MKSARPDPHEFAANYLFPDGLAPYFAAAREVDNGGGSRRGTFEFDGETWNVTLSYQEGGLAPPDGGTTPDGTSVEFEGPLREFRLNAVVDDDVGEKKVKNLIQPRWKGLESHEEGEPVARPVWEIGDAVNVRAQASNVEFSDVPDIIALAASAVGIDGEKFARERVHNYSTLVDAARYVRIQADASGPIHARDGPIARMGHLLENDREGYRKVVQDDTETEGFYHTVTLGPKRVREAFDEHELPREIKHYYPRSPDSFSSTDPLAHPKLEAGYERNRWDESLHPIDDIDQLSDELDEAVLSTLSEAGLPVRVDGSTKPGKGSSVFASDAYFDAEEYDGGTMALPLRLEEIETGQENVVVKHLRDGLSPVEWDSLDMLVSDGGKVSPDDVAEERGWHPDSVRRALRRIDELVERSYGEISLRSHHVAELVTDAVRDAEEYVKEAVETGAKALEMAEQGASRAEQELTAWAANHGIHVTERDARVVVKMGDIGDKSFREMCQQMLDLWVNAGRDPKRLRVATVQYRDEFGSKMRPFNTENSASRRPVDKPTHHDALR